MTSRKGQDGVMAAAVTLVAAVIAIVVVQQVISDQNISGLAGTILPYVPVMMAVGLLTVGGAIAYGRFR